MPSKIVFYRVSAKFVDNENDVPEQSLDIMYFTLSVGHHLGVMDCLTPCFSCSIEEYQALIDAIEDSEARRKLAGLLEFGEIQVDKSHVVLLGNALHQAEEVLLPSEKEGEATSFAWVKEFEEMLAATFEETGMYLMGRVRYDEQ